MYKPRLDHSPLQLLPTPTHPIKTKRQFPPHAQLLKKQPVFLVTFTDCSIKAQKFETIEKAKFVYKQIEPNGHQSIYC